MGDTKPEPKALNPPERKRTYVFASGRVEFENVTHLEVRPSGGHRLHYGPNLKAIVAPGWLAIILDVDGWTL